tara:strand:+ start:708 stop:857 length:150 start_codon:yes stop_codon:yes gene_type:complete
MPTQCGSVVNFARWAPHTPEKICFLSPWLNPTSRLTGKRFGLLDHDSLI